MDDVQDQIQEATSTLQKDAASTSAHDSSEGPAADSDTGGPAPSPDPSESPSDNSIDPLMHPLSQSEPWLCGKDCGCPLRSILNKVELTRAEDELVDPLGLAYRIYESEATCPLLRELLLKPSEAGAVHILSLIRQVVDNETSTSTADNRPHTSVMKLCYRFGIIPSSMVMQNVCKTDDIVRGCGHTADVYEGVQDNRNVPLAIKAIRCPSRTLLESGDMKVFIKEALNWKLLSQADKPINIVPFFGVSFDAIPGKLSLVSEWMPNGTIMEFLKQSGEINVLPHLLQIASAISHLHNHNLVHRDIKGSNVMINGKLQACVTDLGLLRVTHTAPHGSTQVELDAPGTARWMAPELHSETLQETSARVSRSIDIYSFGMTVYEIISGKIPFDEYRVDGYVVMQVAAGERPKQFWTDKNFDQVYSSIWKLIEECWAQNASARPKIKDVIEKINLLPQQTLLPFPRRPRSISDASIESTDSAVTENHPALEVFSKSQQEVGLVRDDSDDEGRSVSAPIEHKYTPLPSSFAEAESTQSGGTTPSNSNLITRSQTPTRDMSPTVEIQTSASQAASTDESSPGILTALNVSLPFTGALIYGVGERLLNHMWKLKDCSEESDDSSVSSKNSQELVTQSDMGRLPVKAEPSGIEVEAQVVKDPQTIEVSGNAHTRGANDTREEVLPDNMCLVERLTSLPRGQLNYQEFQTREQLLAKCLCSKCAEARTAIQENQHAAGLRPAATLSAPALPASEPPSLVASNPASSSESNGVQNTPASSSDSLNQVEPSSSVGEDSNTTGVTPQQTTPNDLQITASQSSGHDDRSVENSGAPESVEARDPLTTVSIPSTVTHIGDSRLIRISRDSPTRSSSKFSGTPEQYPLGGSTNTGLSQSAGTLRQTPLSTDLQSAQYPAMDTAAPRNAINSARRGPYETQCWLENEAVRTHPDFPHPTLSIEELLQKCPCKNCSWDRPSEDQSSSDRASEEFGTWSNTEPTTEPYTANSDAVKDAPAIQNSASLSPVSLPNARAETAYSRSTSNTYTSPADRNNSLASNLAQTAYPHSTYYSPETPSHTSSKFFRPSHSSKKIRSGRSAGKSSQITSSRHSNPSTPYLDSRTPPPLRNAHTPASHRPEESQCWLENEALRPRRYTMLTMRELQEKCPCENCCASGGSHLSISNVVSEMVSSALNTTQSSWSIRGCLVENEYRHMPAFLSLNDRRLMDLQARCTCRKCSESRSQMIKESYDANDDWMPKGPTNPLRLTPRQRDERIAAYKRIPTLPPSPPVPVGQSPYHPAQTIPLFSTHPRQS